MRNISIEHKEMGELTKKLNNISKSALPIAVRNTLNNAAFDDKKNSLQKSARKNFPGMKSPQFFKTFSRVEKATGLDIKKMQSVMGITDLGKRSARNAVENLKKQEFGGIIEDGFSYLKEARGGKLSGKVRRENYYDKGSVISGRSKAGRNKGTNKSKFVARAFRAKKWNRPMFFNSMRGNFLVKVSVAKKTKKGIKLKFKFLMKERASKPSKIKGTSFIKEAAQDTSKKIPALFQVEAEKQFNKALK